MGRPGYRPLARPVRLPASRAVDSSELLVIRFVTASLRVRFNSLGVVVVWARVFHPLHPTIHHHPLHPLSILRPANFDASPWFRTWRSRFMTNRGVTIGGSRCLIRRTLLQTDGGSSATHPTAETLLTRSQTLGLCHRCGAFTGRWPGRSNLDFARHLIKNTRKREF